MQLESEVLSILRWGFYLVMVLSTGILIKLWLKDHKNKSYKWFYAQLFLLHFCLLKFLKLIKIDSEIPQAMILEQNSLTLGAVGIYWGLSMICMLIGIWNLGKKDKG